MHQRRRLKAQIRDARAVMAAESALPAAVMISGVMRTS